MSKPPDTDKVRACPICGKPSVAHHRPFCSKRCADLDLGQWLKGGYGIPAVENESGEDEPDDGKVDKE